MEVENQEGESPLWAVVPLMMTNLRNSEVIAEKHVMGIPYHCKLCT
jgi:hypothetical protein